jgi:hypothetical protein
MIWTCSGAGWAVVCWLGSLWDRGHFEDRGGLA